MLTLQIIIKKFIYSCNKKIWHLFIITIFSALVFSCKKESATNKNIDPFNKLVYGTLQSNIKSNDVIRWLQQNSSSSTPHKNEIIKKVLQNVLFNKMYVERFRQKENLIIVPIKKEYFSQHIDKKKLPPIQYLLLVEDSNGEIRRGDIVLFYPKDINLKALPENSFHDFFNKELLPVDGTFTLITLGDVKQYEMDFKNGEKAAFRIWKSQKNQAQRGSLRCTSWYLVTTTYYSDGHTEVDWSYLGDTCSTCAPNELCDVLEGDGVGGGQGQSGTTTSRGVDFLVKKELTSYENWEISAYFKLEGVTFANNANNFFTGISFTATAITYINSLPNMWIHSSRYSIYSEVNHSCGLLSNTSASASVNVKMYYPNWQPSPLTRTFNMPHTWQASIELH